MTPTEERDIEIKRRQRLEAENAKLKKHMIEDDRDFTKCEVEIYELKAENAKLKEEHAIWNANQAIKIKELQSRLDICVGALKDLRDCLNMIFDGNGVAEADRVIISKIDSALGEASHGTS